VNREPQRSGERSGPLKVSTEERNEVRFLIEHHLDMSETMQRRDISIRRPSPRLPLPP